MKRTFAELFANPWRTFREQLDNLRDPLRPLEALASPHPLHTLRDTHRPLENLTNPQRPSAELHRISMNLREAYSTKEYLCEHLRHLCDPWRILAEPLAYLSEP